VGAVVPGISLQLGRDEASHVSLSYEETSLLYAKHPSQNASDHSVRLMTQYAGAKVSVNGLDQLEVLSSIYGGGSTLGVRLNRITMADTYTLTYRATEKTSTYIRGVHSRVDFSGNVPLYDYDTLRGILGGSYQFSPKLNLLSEIYYGQSSSTPNLSTLRDGPYTWTLGGFLGARGEFSSKLTGSLKAGFESHGYGNGDSAPSSPVFEGAVTYRISERTGLSLQYFRSSEVSVEFAEYSYYRDRVVFHVDQMLGQSGKLVASGNVEYELDSYDRTALRPTRNDDRLRLNASLSYQIKLWMVAALNYDFERFSSDVPGVINYNVNRVGTQLSIGF